MLKIIATDVVVSKGYGDKPAIRYSDDGSCVRFRIGKRVYDKREKENHRWININVKAFGDLCERIRKMQLKEGSFIHLEGRFEEDVWDDDNGQSVRMPVIILSDLEYSYSGSGNGNGNGNGKKKETGTPADEPEGYQGNIEAQEPHQQQAPAQQQEMPDNFTGFQGFGGVNPFFPQG